jgi:hypothetical protein
MLLIVFAWCFSIPLPEYQWICGESWMRGSFLLGREKAMKRGKKTRLGRIGLFTLWAYRLMRKIHVAYLQ